MKLMTTDKKLQKQILEILFQSHENGDEVKVWPEDHIEIFDLIRLMKEPWLSHGKEDEPHGSDSVAFMLIDHMVEDSDGISIPEDAIDILFEVLQTTPVTTIEVDGEQEYWLDLCANHEAPNLAERFGDEVLFQCVDPEDFNLISDPMECHCAHHLMMFALKHDIPEVDIQAGLENYRQNNEPTDVRVFLSNSINESGASANVLGKLIDAGLDINEFVCLEMQDYRHSDLHVPDELQVHIRSLPNATGNLLACAINHIHTDLAKAIISRSSYDKDAPIFEVDDAKFNTAQFLKATKGLYCYSDEDEFSAHANAISRSIDAVEASRLARQAVQDIKNSSKPSV